MLRLKRSLLAVAMALVIVPVGAGSSPVSAATTTLDWTQVSTGGPSAREGAYMAFDSARGKTVLFGGAEPLPTSNKFDSDTWEFDGSTWVRVGTSGPPPGGLGNMVYDSARGVSVLFGGGDNTGWLPNTTWEWNGTAWVARTTAHSPPARIWAGMVYDSTRHVTVLFGGSGVAGDLADTWEYDGNDWRQVVTADSPPPRMGLGLAYDPKRAKTVMFGGHGSTGRLQDTWEYDGVDWTQIAIANPPYARFQQAMAYDAALNEVVMFGGDYFVPSVTLGPNSETWAYDGIGWQQLTPTDHPSARAMMPMIYDTTHAQLVLFGGSNETFPDTAQGDTWTFGTVGPAPAAVLSVPFIHFNQSPVFVPETTSITLSNPGNAPLNVTAISATGDFSTTDDCPRAPATLGVGEICNVNVTFTPSTGDGILNTIRGTLTVTDDAGTGSQSIPLTGTGQWGFLSLAPSPLDLGSAVTNPTGPTSSAIETITVPAQPTVITGFGSSGPFFAENVDCPIGVPLSNGATCHVRVDFGPSLPGTYSGLLIVNDSEPGYRHTVALSGTGLAFPAVTVSIQVSGQPVFDGSVVAQAITNATSGTATFTINGNQVGGPVDLNVAGVATAVIPLNDSTIPAGAGSYVLSVTVHPTDLAHSDAGATSIVNVQPAPVTITWNGAGLLSQGAAANLSVVVNTPSTDAQVDYSTHSVWVCFDVTAAGGSTSTYSAPVSAPSGVAFASVATGPLAAGAYRVRAHLYSAQSCSASNPFVAGEDVITAVAVQPVKGGYMSGYAALPGVTAGFEFSPSTGLHGALVVVQLIQVTGAQGDLRDAYQVITSTSVASVSSHSHVATATGSYTAAVFDAITGARYSAFDMSGTFTINVLANGSTNINLWFTLSLPPGSGVNHL